MPRPYDFTSKTKRIVAQRVNYVCSNPNCLALTASFNREQSKSTLTGECAHINTGSDWGPRPSDKPIKYLKSAANAIWLCCNCHALVDGDESAYSAEDLFEWKKSTEKRIRKWIEKNDSPFRKVQELNKLTQSGSTNDDFDILFNSLRTDDDFDILFNSLRTKIDIYTILNSNDNTLTFLNNMGCFQNKLTPTNQFFYNDILWQIYNNLGDITHAKEHLEKTLEIPIQIPNKVFNRGFLAYLNHNYTQVKQIAQDLIDKPEYYYLLLVMSISNSEELESLVKIIEDNGIQFINVLINVAIKGKDFHEVHICRKYSKLTLEQDPKVPSILYSCAQNLIFSITEDQDIDLQFPNYDVMDDLRTVVKILSDLQTSGKIVDENRIWVMYFKANAYFLLKKYKEALLILDEIGEGSNLELDKQILKVRIFNAKKQYQESKQILEKLLHDVIDSISIKYLYASCLLNIQETKAFKDFFDELFKDSKYRTKLDFIRLYSQYLSIYHGSKESEDYLNKTYEETQDIEILLENLYQNYSMLDSVLIQEYYDKNIKDKINKLNKISTSRLALFMAHHALFCIAVELFEKIYDENLNRIYQEAYFNSLINLKNYIKVISLTSHLRKTKQTTEYVQYETTALESLDRIQEAEEISKGFYNSMKTLSAACMYGHYLLLLGKKEEVKSLLHLFSNKTIKSESDFYSYCVLLAKISEYSILLDVMYKFIRVNKGNEKAVNCFISIFMSFSRKKDFKDYVKPYDLEVKEDSGIMVKSDEGTKLIYLYDHQEADNSLYEYNSQSEWWNELLGKHKGDKILKTRMGIEKKYRIIDIQHRIVIKFNELLNFVSEYGHQNYLVKVNVDLSKDLIEEINQKFGKSLKDMHDRIDYVESIYRDNPIPIAFVADILGKNIITTYLRLFYSDDIKFWASSGNINESAISYQLLENSNSLMLDFTSILFIGKHELWTPLSKTFNLYCAKHSVDLIEEYIDNELTILLEVEGFLSNQDNKPVFVPNDKEGIKKSIEWYNHLLKDIKQYTGIITEDEQLNLYELKKLYKLDTLSRAELKSLDIDTIALAIHQNIPLYSDDFGYRIIISEHGVKCTWSQIILKYLLDKECITIDKFYQITTELLSIGYHFIHISSNMLYNIIIRNNFKHTAEVDLYFNGIMVSNLEIIQKIMVDVLARKMNRQNLADVIYIFLNKIWSKFNNIAAITSTKTFINISLSGPLLTYMNKIFDKWMSVVPRL